VTSWGAFAGAEPALATTGRHLLERSGTGKGLLATVRGDAPPRINPVTVGIVDGRLLVFVIVGSAKDGDLRSDGRYALHSPWDPDAPDEFLVRGRATELADATLRATVAAGWAFEVDDGYRLFELGVESALVGERPDADPDAWPPAYRSWRAPAG
jgi:hypothetical protein